MLLPINQVNHFKAFEDFFNNENYFYNETDFKETEENFFIQVKIPEIKEEDINLTYKNNILALKVEVTKIEDKQKKL